MFDIISKNRLAPNTIEMRIRALKIAQKARPGQFLIIRTQEASERIPLTIADVISDSVTIVFQIVGNSTRELSQKRIGDQIKDVCGPLGNPRKITKVGTMVLIGGGCGIAAIYPEAKALKAAGNRIISIIGARSKDFIVWKDRMESVSDTVIITTDDGSEGHKGVVTDSLRKIIDEEDVDEVIAIGPIVMMKFVSLTTKEKDIRTTVSLNPIMIDGIGMCGACRVKIDSETRFCCADGPEFDGHSVDWDNLIARNSTYAKEEKNCDCKS